MANRTITFTFCDDNGEEFEHELPALWAICPDCDGEGASSAYLGAITACDREPGGDWDDDDDFEHYMNGGYDRPCECCKGKGRVLEVDEARSDKDVLAKYHQYQQEQWEYEAICRAERAMGA